MSSGQIRRVTEQQDTSKSGILFVVVRTRRAAFSPCCFHRAISPCRDFTKRFHRVALSPSCDFAVSRFCRVAISPCRDFTKRFHRVALSPCGDFTKLRFRRVAISPSDFTELRFRRLRFYRAIPPCGDFTVRQFHRTRFHQAISPCGAFTMRRFHRAAFVSSGSLYPTESRRNILYRLLPERCFFCRPRQREWTRGRICVPFIPVLTRIDTPQIVRNWPGAACAAAVKRWMRARTASDVYDIFIY